MRLFVSSAITLALLATACGSSTHAIPSGTPTIPAAATIIPSPTKQPPTAAERYYLAAARTKLTGLLARFSALSDLLALNEHNAGANRAAFQALADEAGSWAKEAAPSDRLVSQGLAMDKAAADCALAGEVGVYVIASGDEAQNWKAGLNFCATSARAANKLIP